MYWIVIALTFWGIMELISASSAQKRERKRKADMERVKAEQKAQREAIRQAQERERERLRQIAKLEKEQERQAKEQERLAKEQEKQAEQIMKLEMRIASAESEIAFNREQRDRLFKLLDIEERERDFAIPESKTWQAHQRKVISLENQIHTVQKRIDKANMDKALCESKLA